jgi:glucose-6-phosphate 1-dehydrogenase
LKKTFYDFRALYRDELIPKKTAIVGYARTKLSVEDLRNNISKYIKLKDEKEKEKFDKFIEHNIYVTGAYDKSEDFKNLCKVVAHLEEGKEVANRLFYLALPPTVFEPVTKLIHDHCMANKLLIFLIIYLRISFIYFNGNLMKKKVLFYTQFFKSFSFKVLKNKI